MQNLGSIPKLLPPRICILTRSIVIHTYNKVLLNDIDQKKRKRKREMTGSHIGLFNVSFFFLGILSIVYDRIPGSVDFYVLLTFNFKYHFFSIKEDKIIFHNLISPSGTSFFLLDQSHNSTYTSSI